MRQGGYPLPMAIGRCDIAPGRGPARAGGRRAFTLVELMVVIVIIVILMGIGLAAAGQVSHNGKVRATQGLLRTLDQTLADYQATTGSKVPGNVRDAVGNEFPIIDGRPMVLAGGTAPATPSQALYMTALRRAPTAAALLGSVDPTFVTRVTALSMAGLGALTFERGQVPPTGNPEGVVVLKDAWGEVIRFVHPKYHGGFGDFYTRGTSGTWTNEARAPLQVTLRNGGGLATIDFRRSAMPFDPDSAPADWKGDADEGLCPGGQPYFYSSGPDKDPGRREDNIYTTIPNFTGESMSSSGV